MSLGNISSLRYFPFVFLFFLKQKKKKKKIFPSTKLTKIKAFGGTSAGTTSFENA